MAVKFPNGIQIIAPSAAGNMAELDGSGNVLDSGQQVIPWNVDSSSLNGVTRIRSSTYNFLTNADFESWNNGTSVAPPAWTISGGATISQQAALSVGSFCAQVVFDTSNTGVFYQSVPSSTAVDYTFTCYVKRTSGTGTANLVARDGDSPFTSFATCALNTTGSIGLAALTVKPSAGANLRFSIEATSTSTSTWQIDECMLQESKAVATTFVRAAIDDSTNQFVFGPKTWGGGQSTYSGGFKLYDGSSTYLVTFNAAGTAAGNVSLNYPVTNDTLVGRATTDTLTNKTLTSPVINNPTGFLTGASNITVGTTAPSSPNVGDLWVDTN